MTVKLRFAFAGDRDIAVWVLDFMLDQGARPLALMVSGPERASHAEELRTRCAFLNPMDVLVGRAFTQAANLHRLRQLDLDFIIGIHFPYLIPEEVLAIPKQGVLNLHPAYLPYNRGWHTGPSSKAPIGATLHS
jgi:methionyl-tRNA formyltransferase